MLLMKNTIKNLEKNRFTVHHVATGQETFDLVKTFVTPGLSVGMGGSTTVAQLGLLSWLQANDTINLYNQYEEGISREEAFERRRQGLLSDLYITGCNAITEAGELVNVDGDGNRVAAQIFGPRRVLLIASTNKIVSDVDAAFERIRTVAVPQNIERMNAKAIAMGKEPRWGPENIGTKFVTITKDKPGRTTIILVDEPLGF